MVVVVTIAVVVMMIAMLTMLAIVLTALILNLIFDLILVALVLVRVATIAILLLALLCLVEAGDAILLGAVCRLLNLWLELLSKYRIDLSTVAIYGQNLTHARYRNSYEIRHRILACREGHRMGENIALYEEVFAIDSL